MQFHFENQTYAAQQKLFLLEQTELRTTSSGTKFGATTVLASTTKFERVHDLFTNEGNIGKLNNLVKKTIMVKGFTQKEDGTISISENTKIMETTTEITTEQINKFLQPEVTEIAVIKTKQKNERVSVQGSIEKTTGVLETPTSRRKIITIIDKSGEIDVKLWGEKINLLKGDTGLTITIKGLKVDLYNGRYSLNSTPTTTAEINQQVQQIHGKVEAASFDYEDMSIMIQGEIYTLTATKMGLVFPMLQFVADKVVTIAVQGVNVTDILDVSDEPDLPNP